MVRQHDRVSRWAAAALALLFVASVLPPRAVAQIRAGLINLTSMVTGILPGANGGTGNGFFAVSGPGSTLKTFAFPNASATMLTTNAAVTAAQGGTGQTTPTADAAMIGDGSAWNMKVLPSCSDSSTEKLLYNSTTDAFSCGTDAGSAGGGAPDNAEYWTAAASGGLSAEKNLGALGTGLVLNTAGTPSAYAGSACGTAGQYVSSISASGVVTCAAVGPFSVTALTSGTGATYTVPAGVYRLRVRGVGPGGGGGGGDQGAAQSGAGGGGGAGGYFEKFYSTTPAATFTYTIGVGGAGGVAGNNAGSNGSTATVFDSGGTPITGNVGNGGASMAAGTTVAAAAGGAGGTATGGDVNITGQIGGQSIRQSVSNFRVGEGGSNLLGFGQLYQSSGAGAVGTGYGSGGSGGSNFAATADVAGGNGATGVIIVEEYK